MHEFELIRKYFSKLTYSSKSSLNLNDDVFFDKNNKLVVSIDTYIEGNHFVNFKKPECLYLSLDVCKDCSLLSHTDPNLLWVAF